MARLPAMRIAQLAARAAVVAFYWFALANIFGHSVLKGGPLWWNGICLWESPLKAMILAASLVVAVMLSVGFLRAPNYASATTGLCSRSRGLYIGMSRLSLMALTLYLAIPALDYAGCPGCERPGRVCVTYRHGEDYKETTRKAFEAKGMKSPY